MALLRSIATVGGYTMISRLLGFARDILIAATLGAGPVADAFFVAFKLPNFFRRLFAEGAFNAAFVPLFTRQMSEGGRDAARAFTEEVLSVFVVTLLFFVTALQIAMPWVMYGFAPGFADDPYRFGLAVELAQVTFPYLLFISLVSQLGGVLNSLGRFAAAAATPIILNLCLIAAILGLSPFLETPGHALAWGVAVAGAAQFIWLMVACHRAEFRLRLLRPRLTPRVKRLLFLMLPGVIGAGVVQINLLIDVVIASLLPSGSVSFLYYADRINQLPLGVIGVALGVALLPQISRQAQSGDEAAAQASLGRGVEIGLWLTLPAAMAAFAAPELLVRALFERGAFSAADAAATAAALQAYAVGLPAFVLAKTLAPGYFARADTKTPARAAAISVGLNIALGLALMWPLGHVGLALATTIASWMQVALLWRGLRRAGWHTSRPGGMRRLLGLGAAAATMGVCLAAAAPLALGMSGDLMRLGVTLGLCALACLIYLLIAHGLGAARIDDAWRELRRGSKSA